MVAYRKNKSVVQLKVTDNDSVIKYEAHSRGELKLVNKLNSLFLDLATEPREGVTAAPSTRRRRKA